jgi:hypothetical protein
MQEGEVNRTPDVFLEATRYRSSGKVIALGRLSCSVVKGHNQDVAKRGSVRDACNISSLSPDFVALTRSCRIYQILSHSPQSVVLITVRRTHHNSSHLLSLVACPSLRRTSYILLRILHFVALPSIRRTHVSHSWLSADSSSYQSW